MEKIKIKPREEHSFFDVKLLPRSEIKIKFSSRFRDSIFESYFLRSLFSLGKNHLFKLETKFRFDFTSGKGNARFRSILSLTNC